MFLVPKRIYFAMRNSIGDEVKVNQLDRLNMDTNYIEKAIQLRQQKSFKSQPEAWKKTVSTLADTSSLNTTRMNNNKQAAPATNISIPACSVLYISISIYLYLYIYLSISVHLCLLFSAEYRLVPYTHTPWRQSRKVEPWKFFFKSSAQRNPDQASMP